MKYLGDFAEDATVHFMWNSFDGAGGSITRATDGTISVYKDNGTTQSTAGVTDTEDFDSLTGVHAVTIDTSADAFYATGSNYSVVLSAATIDGETVNAVLAEFSIENRTAFPKADYPSNFSALGIEGDGDLTKVNTLDGHTAQTGDNYARIGSPAGASVSADVAAVKAETASILDDTDLIDDATSGLAKIATDVAAVLVDTAEIGAAGAGLTAVQWNASWDAEVQSEVTDALNAYDPPTNAEMEARTLAAASYPTTGDIPTATVIADTLLNRDMSVGTDSTTSRTPRQALRFLRNKWAVSAGTLTVYKENDSTVSWTSTVAASSAATPITGSDPA